jgi:hypothetical protein
MKTTLPKLDRCQQAMERTLVQGNPVFVFLINMNKTCVPFSLFVLCTLVHWHARVFIFFVAEKHDIFSVQTNWHARWDVVLLPSLPRNNGRRLQAGVFSGMQVVVTMVLFWMPHLM